jgi:hypothetical protein
MYIVLGALLAQAALIPTVIAFALVNCAEAAVTAASSSGPLLVAVAAGLLAIAFAWFTRPQKEAGRRTTRKA